MAASTQLTADQIEQALSDLGGRVGALEDGQQAAFAPQNTFFIEPEGGKTVIQTPLGTMFWEGVWDKESGFEPGALVRFQSHLYICYKQVPKINFVLGPGPTSKALNGPQGPVGVPIPPIPPVARLSFQEEQSGLLLPTQPTYGGAGSNVELKMHGVMYEFWAKTATEAFNLEIVATPDAGKLKPGEATHWMQVAFFNDFLDFEGHNRSQTVWEPGSHVVAIEKGEFGWGKAGEEKRFYLFINGAVEEVETIHGREVLEKLPCPFTIELGAECTHIVDGPSNPTPPADPEHWELMI